MGMLDNRVAVITGAGRGIGAETAKLFAAEGAKIVVNDLGGAVDGSGSASSPADEVVAYINDMGGQAVANYASVADYNAAESIVKDALDNFGDLDIVVNTAGILRDRMVFNMTEEEWDAVLDVHLKGHFNLTKYASIHWRANRKGHYRLINFSSVSGIFGAPGQPNYAAAKMGIVGFTYSCANALPRYGATANAISPGASTRMTDTVPEDRRQAGSIDSSAQDPRRSPANVSIPLVYIASEQSDWLNGQIIGASGYDLQLFNKPAVIRQMRGTEPWTVEGAAEQFEQIFKPVVEGGGFYG